MNRGEDALACKEGEAGGDDEEGEVAHAELAGVDKRYHGAGSREADRGAD